MASDSLFAALISSIVWRAIMSSSSVGMTHAETRLSAVLIQGPPAALASGSNSIPSQPASLQTCSRIASRVLANSTREHQDVQPSERRTKRTKFAADTVHEQLNGFGSARICACRQSTHVAAYARDTQQTRLVIQQVRHISHIHPFFSYQIQHDSGIEGAAAAAHGQTVDSAKSHAGGDTPACLHGTHTGALTEVGDDYFAVQRRSRIVRQNRSDVLVRESMKAVSSNTRLRKCARNCKVSCT